MLVHEGYLYAVNDNGIAICWRARDGQEMWKERLRAPVSPSPILAGGKIYASNEMPDTPFGALRTGPVIPRERSDRGSLNLVAVNPLG